MPHGGRLTKKEARALLEFIKECYSICDLETQRVISRLSKIVPKEIISYNGVNPCRRRNADHITAQEKIFEPHVFERPVVIHHGKTRDNPQGHFHHLELHNKVYRRLGEKKSVSATAHKAGRSQL